MGVLIWFGPVHPAAAAALNAGVGLTWTTTPPTTTTSNGARVTVTPYRINRQNNRDLKLVITESTDAFNTVPPLIINFTNKF